MSTQQRSGSVDRAVPGGTEHRWLALGVVALAQLMVALDATIVNVALPTVQRSLGFDDAHRAYVVTAYTLSFAGLLLLGGKASDRFGRRRTLTAGLLGFILSSALAGAAPTFAVLVAGRGLQGASAAFMAPSVLALIASTFTDPGDRGKAFGVFGAVASSGAVLGLMLGGALTEFVGWRWCLYVNVLLGVVVIAAGRRVLPDDAGHRVPVDLGSGLLATGGLAALVFGVSQAASSGWGSVPVAGPGALGLTLLAAFLARQRRLTTPLLPLSILADRGRATAYAATAISVIGTFGMFLMLTYQFQVVLGWSPVHSGVAFLPMSGAVAASSYFLGSKLMDRVAPRLLVAPGLLVAASGLALLATLELHSSYLTVILPAEVLVGAGIGCVFTPSIAVATSGIDRRQAGVAAATANTAMQIGASLGTAVLNTVAVTASAGYVGPPAAVLAHGFASATAVAAVTLLVGALLVVTQLRPATSRSDAFRGEVEDAQQRLLDALVAGDTAALGGLVADECQIIGPKGYGIGKDEWVSTHSSQVYQQVALVQVESEVARYGDVAVRCDLQRSECIYQGELITGLYRVMSVWATRPTGWQLVSTQYTSVSNEAVAAAS